MSAVYTVGCERNDARKRIVFLKDLLASQYWYCGEDDAICDEIAELKAWLNESAGIVVCSTHSCAL